VRCVESGSGLGCALSEKFFFVHGTNAFHLSFLPEKNIVTQREPISQLPKLCKLIEYWCIEYLIFILWVRSFSTRLPSVIFVEEKVLIFLILREKC